MRAGLLRFGRLRAGLLRFGRLRAGRRWFCRLRAGRAGIVAGGAHETAPAGSGAPVEPAARHPAAQRRHVNLAGGGLPRDLPARHHHDAVGQGQDLGQLQAHQQHTCAPAAQLGQLGVHERGRSHIQAPGGLGRDEELRAPAQLPAHHQLLLVAARQAPQGVGHGHGLHPEAVHHAAGQAPHLHQRQPKPPPRERGM